MGYRKLYEDTDSVEMVNSYDPSIRDTLLSSLKASIEAGGNLIVYSESFEDIDTNKKLVHVGKVYYRKAEIE